MNFKKIKRWIKRNEVSTSLLLALTALIISIKGCHEASVATDYSRKAYLLSEQQYSESLLLVLNGKFNEKENDFKLIPVDSSLILQQSEISLPDELGGHIIDVSAPKFSISTLILNNDLTEHLEQKFKKLIGDKKYIGLYEGALPVTLKSYYIVKGIGYTQLSLYALKYRALVGLESVSTDLSFVSLIFIRHLAIDSDIKAILKREWEYNKK